jgi:hypothetical protein
MISLRSTSRRTWGVRSRTAVQFLAGVMGILLLCLPVFSQGSSGRILGTVTDQSGGVVAGATVTITDTERGVSKTFVTNEPGDYNAPALNPGTYKIRVEAKGFKAVERQNVVLEVGKEIRVDVSLQPGAVAETMTITESIPLVETTNATLGGTLNNADINDMPLNGRNYQNLLALRPGVVVQPGGGPWTQSSNNVRPDESGWMVDGVLNVNFYDARPIANMPSPFTDGATILPIDAIQEFNLEENPKAEYGWKPGAVVNVGVRSGTNTFHGATYGFYRSAAWEARSLFNPVDSVAENCHNQLPAFCSKEPLQLKQFGGAVGGPIKKDKLFFFANYEGLRSLLGQELGSSGVPETITNSGKATSAKNCPNLYAANHANTGDCKNSMVDAVREVIAGGGTPSPVSLALTGCTVAPVTCGGSTNLFPSNPSGSTGFLTPFPNVNVSDNGVAKVDYHINSKHSLNGMFLVGNYTGDGQDHPLLNKVFLDTFRARTYTFGADWVWAANSRFVNDFRFGYDRVRAPFVNDDAGRLSDGSGLTGGAGYPINTGVTAFGGLPIINIGPAFQTLGTWHNRPTGWDNWYSDVQDNVSFLVGKHTLKFGAEYAHILVDSTQHDNVRGRIDFSSLTNFYRGVAKSGNIFVGPANRTMVWNSIAEYFQDDWRVGPKLTLNLGLRYTYSQPIKEVNNLWGNFDPNSATGLVQQGQPGVGPTIWKPDRKNVSPRAGFAYDVSGKGTTVVRGGFSVIYSTFIAADFLAQNGLQDTGGTTIGADPTGACIDTVLPGGTCGAGRTYGGTIVTSTTKLPGSSLAWNGPGAVFPTPVPQCSPFSKCNILAVDPNLKTPYVTNWNLGIQRAFGNNLSLEVEYVGTHGSRLTGFVDLNQQDSTGNLKYATQFPGLHFINQISNDGRSNYHSLQTTLTKRTSHGLSFTAGYTYGHGLDNGSLNRAGYLPQDSTKPGAEYGSGDFDIRHRLTVTGSYEIPGIKGYGQLLEGWKLNTIVSLQTSQPWNISESSPNAFNFSNSGDTADRWNFFGNPADFGSGSQSIPWCTGTGGQGPTGPGGGCSYQSGVSGIPTNFAASDSAAMYGKCTAVATSVGAADSLAAAGCFVKGSSFMTPPANDGTTGTFGNTGRNIFRDSGFKNVDFSVFKTFTYKERFSAQFRVEFFNLLNHPLIANPYGSVNGWGVGNDPSLPGTFGCGCATADVAAGNPGIGSGGPRSMQLGLKLSF